MDLLRSSIKVLFHDFSVELIAEYLSAGVPFGSIEERFDRDFIERFKECLKWREPTFTSSEIDIYVEWLKDELLSNREIGMGSDSSIKYSFFERVFISLPCIGRRLLNVSGSVPKVRFQNLLRWRDLSLLIGEDLLTLATAAEYDSMEGVERDTLCWTNILGHDNVIINHILSDTLSDTHAHLWASTDVFEFNWLVVMNHPDIIASLDREKDGISDFLNSGEHRLYDTVTRFSTFHLTLGRWIVIAAILRIRIFQTVVKGYFTPDEMLVLPSFDEERELLSDFAGHLAMVKDNALTLPNGQWFDYAIEESDDDDTASPYMVLRGERKLFYNYFSQYFGNSKDVSYRRLAPMVYLYWLIKIKVRREFVQTNGLRGFENFQKYQNIKNKFVAALKGKDKDMLSALSDASLKFAIQSSVCGSPYNNNFEMRVTAGEVSRIRECPYTKSIFDNKDVFSVSPDAIRSRGGRLSIVVHFLKGEKKYKGEKPNGVVRNNRLRENLRKELDAIKDLNNVADPNLPIVGFDAAGNELKVSPDVFAPTFNALRRMGFSNFTYHVGEDFYDIVHGLRSIDEAVRFLGLSSGCRIGHGLALGVDAKQYYSERHHYSIMPKQVALDNIVWIKFTALKANISLRPATQLFIEEMFERLAEEIGYTNQIENFTMYHYWEAMKLRGTDPLMTEENSEDGLKASNKTGSDRKSEKKPPKKEKESSDSTGSRKYGILELFWRDSYVYKEGNKTCSLELPSVLWEDVVQLQQYMMREIEHKGIIIETNPSSNLRIGPFSRYIDLPIFKFYPPGSTDGVHLPVTVNTDDKGVFATSLENEYSLVAIAMRKHRDANGNRIWNDKVIEDYLRRLAVYGEMTRFRPTAKTTSPFFGTDS